MRVIEAARIGAGSSGGTVGALAPHAPENWNDKKAMQRDALVAAQGWWAGIAAAGGVDPGYARSGRLQPAIPGPALDSRIAAAARHWQGFAMRTCRAPAGPLVPPSPDGLWVVDDLTARIAPRRALAALAAAIRAAGGEIEEGAGPLHPDTLPGPAVWATGAGGLESLSADLGRPMGTGVKGQSALLGLSVPDTPQVYAGGLHIVPHADGTVAIGSTSENDFSDAAPDERLEALIASARAVCPALAGAPVLDRWAGIRPRAASRMTRPVGVGRRSKAPMGVEGFTITAERPSSATMRSTSRSASVLEALYGPMASSGAAAKSGRPSRTASPPRPSRARASKAASSARARATTGAGRPASRATCTPKLRSAGPGRTSWRNTGSPSQSVAATWALAAPGRRPATPATFSS